MQRAPRCALSNMSLRRENWQRLSEEKLSEVTPIDCFRRLQAGGLAENVAHSGSHLSLRLLRPSLAYAELPNQTQPASIDCAVSGVLKNEFLLREPPRFVEHSSGLAVPSGQEATEVIRCAVLLLLASDTAGLHVATSFPSLLPVQLQ
jgi:hypothetical protein